MSFFASIKICFNKYFSYQGRAKRSEYWYFVLFINIINFVVIFIEFLLLEMGFYNIGAFSNFVFLIFLFPGINVTTRRLHDVNRSGWWQLLYITGIGSLVILYWTIIKGAVEENKFN